MIRMVIKRDNGAHGTVENESLSFYLVRWSFTKTHSWIEKEKVTLLDEDWFI